MTLTAFYEYEAKIRVEESERNSSYAIEDAKNSYHLPRFRTLLYISYDLLLLLLQLGAFAIQLSYRLLQCALMFPELLCRRLPLSEQSIKHYLQ